MLSSRSFLAATATALTALISPALAEVNWVTSFDTAKASAVERDVPIYLHIGDPLNELTGAMHRQTFANEEVAAFLNDHFVCVNVDRDAVPGLAGYGQQWLAADQKLAGWPLNLWFTPELAPIEGASYLPPTEEWGREGFMVVAGRVAERWSADAEAVRRATATTQQSIVDYLPFAAEPVDDLNAALGAAAADWLALHNADLGTFGDAPHRLEPELIRFLIARGGDAREAALTALRTRILSPLRDPIDGGFYRATSDAHGLIPVFQKRLTDQARIALACLDAAQVNEDPVFAAGARSALDYAIKRLSPTGDGTFVIGEDATAGAATAHQTWAWDDLVSIVGADAAATLGAKPEGNVASDEDLEGHHTGRNILNASPVVMRDQAMVDLRAKLLSHRADQAPTLLEITATAGAHGLMLHALKRSEAELDDRDHGAYARSVQTALMRDFAAGTESFMRICKHDIPATPEDFVLVALGLGDPSLAAQADRRFYDEELGLYTVTADDVLGLRPLWWSTGAGELPSPAVWRVLLGNAPEQMITELTLPFENPDAPPAGDVLLALQSTLP